MQRICLYMALLSRAVQAGHYEKPPCGHDEVQGEVQGVPGYICAPRCDKGSYDCVSDAPDGTTATPQCMLKDVDAGAFCGLLCQSDTQCPSGAQCKQIKQPEVGLCVFPVSFS